MTGIPSLGTHEMNKMDDDKDSEYNLSYIIE